MERSQSPRTALRRLKRSQHGASIVEAVIALPILLVVILGAIQFGLVYEAKATLNHASLQAARLGAVRNAQPDAIRRGLARGLAPLHSPDSSLTAIASTITRINNDLRTDARIRILNPTREAFADFGVDVDGEREIPNDRLHTRATAVGAQSGINIQDANLLKVQITYGYELQVPLVNWFIARVLLGVSRNTDGFEQQLLRRTRLPIIATATVRMQSPARMSDSVVSRSDFPALDRIPSNAAPPPVTDEAQENQPPQGNGNPSSDEEDSSDDDGSSLGDGFLGFGGGSPSGGGGSGGSQGGGVGGGLNGGNPLQCSSDGGGAAPFPINPPPGDFSPVPNRPGLPLWNVTGSGAHLDSVSLASLSVGNPIHVVTGNKYQAETDIEPLPGLLGLMFQRHYNSAAIHERSVIGAGWRHSYQATLTQLSDGSIRIVQADGRLIQFKRESAASPRFLAQRASDGVLVASGDGFLWQWNSQRTLHFGADGRLLRMRDGSGELMLRYNDAGELISATDPQERELRFEYYPNGRLANVRGPGKIGSHYTYDSKGNLSQVAGNDGNARRYAYEDERHPHHLTGILVGSVRPLAYGERKPFERIATWAYDESGRGVFSSHPDDAGKVTLSFGEHDTEVTDAFGRKTRYVFDWRDGVAYVREVRGPGCGSCGQGDASYEFGLRFERTQVAVKNAPTFRYRYDIEGRLVEIQRVIDGKPEWTTRYAYDGMSSRVTRVERPSVKPGALATLEIAYGPTGMIERTREQGFSPHEATYRTIERVTSFAYDDRGRLIRIDGPRGDVDDRVDIDYDDFGRVVGVRTPAGATKIASHDAAGRPVRLLQTGRPDIKLQYDMHGRVTSVAQVRSQGELKVTYQYDSAGRLALVTDSLGRRTRYGFDAAGRPNRLSRSDSNISTVAQYGPDDSIERIGAFGANGQLLRTLYYAYDSQRRLIEVRDGTGQPLQQLGYFDDDALPDRKLDPLGHETSLHYDALGQLASIIAPDGGSTRYERDAFGRTTRIESPNHTATAYVYDDFGRRVREASPDRGVTQYVYDAVGNLIKKIDARGVTIRLTYDAANRLIQTQRAEGTSTLKYTAGLLTEVDGEFADERYEYDSDSQLIKHTRLIGNHEYTTSYSYDAHGRLEARELPSGARLRYRYSENGLLQSITQERWLGGRLLAHSRSLSAAEPAGTLAALGSFTAGNGVDTHTTFDASSGNISRRAVERVAALAYEHDEAGRLTALRRDNDQRQYDYDSVGRVTSASTARGDFAFAYDKNGNRLASTYFLREQLADEGTATVRTASAPSPAKRGRGGEGAVSTSPARNDLLANDVRMAYDRHSNRLASVGGSAPTIKYKYDAAGNPVSVGTRRYEYDTHGRMTKLYDNDRLVAEYRYNFWGERVQKVVHANGERHVTSFIYEQQKLIAEADDRGNILREYIYLDHHPIAMLVDGAAYWIHTDHLGTPIAVTNNNRTVIWRADYQPFGEALIEDDPDGNKKSFTLNLRFPGQYADAESGTHYNYFRDYDPKTGRYLTSDPLGMAAGTNSFAYVGNDPVNGIDRLGLYQEDVHYYMTLFLAITAGVNPQEARQIALAAAFVDVNEATRPTDPESWSSIVESGFSNQPQLLLYHFVLASPTDGRTLEEYRNGNYHSVATQLSPQLTRMFGYATSAPSYVTEARSNCDQDAVQLQFFGEFLHSLADTYSHRNRSDQPYDATALEYGFGHGLDGHWPDHTFNEDSWISRETRTYSMELDVRDKLRQSRWADPNRSTTASQFDLLSDILRDFNGIVESEQHFGSDDQSSSELWLRSQKIERLNRGLRQLGYDSVDLRSDEYRFDEEAARRNRVEAFRDLNREDYVHAILETR